MFLEDKKVKVLKESLQNRHSGSIQTCMGSAAPTPSEVWSMVKPLGTSLAGRATLLGMFFSSIYQSTRSILHAKIYYSVIRVMVANRLCTESIQMCLEETSSWVFLVGVFW